jgi:hypothetical protein
MATEDCKQWPVSRRLEQQPGSEVTSIDADLALSIQRSCRLVETDDGEVTATRMSVTSLLAPD